MVELVWGLYTGRQVGFDAILFKDFMFYLSVSQKSPRKIHSAHFWPMCIDRLYSLHDVQLPATADDIPLEMQSFEGYTPKYDPIFGAIRRLTDAFLSFDDDSNIFVSHPLTLTENVEPYPPEPLRKQPQA